MHEDGHPFLSVESKESWSNLIFVFVLSETINFFISKL
jgi:hypothetical protein